MATMRNPSQKRWLHFQDLVAHDQQHAGFGVALAGMDEVGRGPLYGPVVAACVIMPAEPLFPWVDDSKKLSAARRREVCLQIREHALFIGVGRASSQEIDEINILNATRLAMERAAGKAPATLCLVDAVKELHLPFPTYSILHGDAASYHIAAASIVAKVERDQEMERDALLYPGYGLETNMGYGTAAHIQALRTLGPTSQHRKTFIRHLL